MKDIDAERLIHELEERIYAYSEGHADGDDYRKDAIETLLKDVRYQCSLQQEQPEVEWKEGFYSHSIKARVYPCLDKNTVRVESDERLEKNEYLYPGRNVRMVILLDNKDNTLNARKK